MTTTGSFRMMLAGATLAALGLCVGCAHTEEEEQRRQAQRQEMDVLKERVRRLERRLGDLDTKMTILLDKADQQEATAGASGPSVSSGPWPSAPAPRYRTPIGVGGPDDPSAGIEPPPIAVGPGARPVDLPGRTGFQEPTDPDPGERLIVGDEPADGPVLIDDDAVARLERKKGEGDERRAYSRTPNRRITRSNTRPGPGTRKRSAVSAQARPRKGMSARAASGQSAGGRTASPMPAGNVKRLYAWGMARREEGEHAQAVGAFDEVLRRYPDHHLADNAVYWSGVCHQARGAYQDALKSWRMLPMRFPKSPKLPDALFGMAQVHESLGDTDTSVDLYLQLIDQYPRAERAPLARAALARLRR